MIEDIKTIINRPYLFNLDVTYSVKIVHHSINNTIDGGNSSASILMDCDYIYDPGDIKLVVRWFHNDSPEAIYQWIPSSDNRYIGELLRPYFDLNFKASEDRFTKYRAMRLVATQQMGSSTNGLPMALSGKFTCVISSILSQDSRQGQLTIFSK